MKKWLALLALILAYTPVYAQAPTWTLGTLGIARNVTPNQIGVNIGTSSANFIPIGTVSGGVFAIGAIPFSSITNTSTQLFGTSNIWTAYQDFSATYIGAGYAASRVGGWVNNIWAGSQYQVISPIFAASVPTGGGAATFAARMSDTVGGGFGSIQPDRCLAYVDANPSVYPSWCRYTEGRTASGTTGWHINEESSIDNRWASPAIDPYAVNLLNGTRNLRLDCGIGSGSPTKCSDALEIVNNGATYYNGIVFSDDALDTSSGRIAPALALAKNHSVAWYYGTHGTPGSQSWSLYANATAPGGTIVLGNSAFNILGTGAEASTTFLYLSNTGAGLLAAGRSDGNQAALTGAASGSAPALIAAGVDANISLALQAKGTGAINALSRLTTIASTTGVAGLNIAPGVAPTSPVNGDLWGTTTGLFARVNGATEQLATVDGSVQISSLGTGVVTGLGHAVDNSGGFLTYGGANSTGVNYTSGATASPATQTVTGKLDTIVLLTDDSGVDSTGVGDSTAGIVRVIAANAGKVIRVPAGTYKISSELWVVSNTHIECDKGAVFQQTSYRPVFSNTNANTNWQTDVTTPSPATQTDTNISVRGCTADYTANASTTSNPATHTNAQAFLIRLANGVTLENNRIIGDITGVTQAKVPNAIAIVASANVRVINNYGYGVYNGFGLWDGSSDIVARGNTFYVAVNTYNSNPFSCSNINGAGTVAGDHQTTRDFIYENNICYTQGGTGGHTVVAYNNGTLSSGSRMINGVFRGNTTIATGTGNSCYLAKGWIDSFDMIDNRFEGCDTLGLIAASNVTALGSQTNVLSTTNGSALVTATIGSVTTGIVSIGNYVAFSGSPTIGGLTLSGTYPITSVSAGSFVFNAGSNASSTVAAGGGTTTVTVYWGAYRNSRFINNKFVNTNSLPNDAVLAAMGPGNVIGNTSVDGGTYGGIVLTSSYDCCGSSVTGIVNRVYGTQGVAGSGVTSPTGGGVVVGDATVAYPTSYAPIIFDNAVQSADRVSWTPSLKFGGGGTGMTYATQTGQYWVIGKQINICGQIALSAKGSSTGAATITGLPFTSDTMRQSVKPSYAANFVSVTYPAPTMSISPSASQITLFSDYGVTTLNDTNFSNSSSLNFCGSYMIP